MFCIGLGLFFTFAATILAVLSSIGQLTNNVVSRNIRMVEVNTAGFQDFLRTNVSADVATSIYAVDQSAPELSANGLKQNYQWGLYTFCAGQSTSGPRSCVDSSIGFRWAPLEVLQADVTEQYRQTVTNAIGTGKFTDSDYLSKFTHAANYLLLVGTVFTGLAWLTGFLAHRFAFAFAALLALVGALLVGVGSAVWTATAYKARNSLPADIGITVDYGNGLWMFWATFVGDALAIIPFILSCCVGRSKY